VGKGEVGFPSKQTLNGRGGPEALRTLSLRERIVATRTQDRKSCPCQERGEERKKSTCLYSYTTARGEKTLSAPQKQEEGVARAHQVARVLFTTLQLLGSQQVWRATHAKMPVGNERGCSGIYLPSFKPIKEAKTRNRQQGRRVILILAGGVSGNYHTHRKSSCRKHSTC